MRFGPNSGIITILRRAALANNAGGVARGDFAIAFTTFADWRYQSARELVEAGVAQDETNLVMRVNDTMRNRGITAADRLAIGDYTNFGTLAGVLTYDIRNVAPRDRVQGSITMVVVRRLS